MHPGRDCSTFGASASFVQSLSTFGSCLSPLGLGGGNEALLFFATALALQVAMTNFLSLTALAFASFMASAQLRAGFWWHRKLQRKLDNGWGERGSCIPVVL